MLGDRPIETIGTTDLMAVLEPIWTEKHDTARRVKNRLANVFDWAKGKGHYRSENPVNGLKHALPRVRNAPRHMPALDWRELPTFMGELKNREGISALALRFLILTAMRSNEVRGARWREISGNIWVVPGDRMKAGQEHRVPLTGDALEVLETVRGLDADFVFPSPSTSGAGAKPMSDTVFKALMVRMGYPNITTHGFRSTFRNWCSEFAHADREVAEAALAHKFGTKVERAYARSDLFDRRRKLMELWSQYANGRNAHVMTLRTVAGKEQKK